MPHKIKNLFSLYFSFKVGISKIENNALVYTLTKYLWLRGVDEWWPYSYCSAVLNVSCIPECNAPSNHHEEPFPYHRMREIWVHQILLLGESGIGFHCSNQLNHCNLFSIPTYIRSLCVQELVRKMKRLFITNANNIFWALPSCTASHWNFGMVWNQASNSLGCLFLFSNICFVVEIR